MSFPSMSSMWLPSIKWFAWQAQQGQDSTYWWKKILESESFWRDTEIDTEGYSFTIATIAATKEGLQENAELVKELFIHAKLGVLAGLFERSSHTTSADVCHPLVWNAMISFCLSISQMEGRMPMPRTAPALREGTTLAGYALGKVPDVSPQQVFVSWR